MSETLESIKAAWFKGCPPLLRLDSNATEKLTPVPGERNYLVTSALPYVNNIPHLGNLIGSVLSADVYARYCRLRQYNVLYISGTDEYGTATEIKAMQEGETPKQICDKYHQIHSQVYQWFNIQFDHFGRTSCDSQTEICQEIFLELDKKGYTFTEFVDQWLCEGCDMYLADRLVVGVCPKCRLEDARGDQCDSCGCLINAIDLERPRCKACGATPIKKSSIHYFLDLPKLEPLVKKRLEYVDGGWSRNAKAIAEACLKDGLKPRCITRDLKWGVPVPVHKFDTKVFYVWFDAPIGYLSMTKEYSKQWRSWWLPEEGTSVELVQFMAKDNVPFHSVVFPACLLGTHRPYTLVNKIFATEYLTYEGAKFSKTRGIGVFGTDAADTGISPDVWRFYLLYIRPESQDSSFSWRDLALKNNSELLNNLGNFVLRTLRFLDANFFSTVPDIKLGEPECKIIELVNQQLRSYTTNLEQGRLRDGLRNILAISRTGNQYFQGEQPWALVKRHEEDKARAGSIVGFSCNMVCLIALLLAPYMPSTSELLLAQMGLSGHSLRLQDTFTMLVRPGTTINTPAPLFTKIEDSFIDRLLQKFSGSAK